MLQTLTIAALLAQSPYTVAPRNYRLEFENDQVVISRASFQPGDKLPVHEHPPLPVVYVYLTDGGSMLFWHKEGEPAGRPAVKAGSFRFHRGVTETHEVSYLGDQPSEYLRVEWKLDRELFPRGDVRRRFDDERPLEHGPLRVTRCRETCETPSGGAVVVSFEERAARWRAPGEPMPFLSGHRLVIEKR